MIVLVIILAVLAALLLLAVGVDAAYGPDGAAVAVKIGPLRVQLLPKRERKAKPKPSKENAAQAKRPKEKKPGGKKQLDFHFLLALAKMGLHALTRFRKHLSVDRFELFFLSASDDPYTTAMNYAYANMALGSLAPLARQVFRVRESRVETELDFEAERPEIRVRLVLSIQIWEILYVGAAFGVEFLRYKWQHRTPKPPKAGEEPPPANAAPGAAAQKA